MPLTPCGHAKNEQPGSALAATADPMKCRGRRTGTKAPRSSDTSGVLEHDRPVRFQVLNRRWATDMDLPTAGGGLFALLFAEAVRAPRGKDRAGHNAALAPAMMWREPQPSELRT
jgi:hypothetical protein